MAAVEQPDNVWRENLLGSPAELVPQLASTLIPNDRHTEMRSERGLNLFLANRLNLRLKIFNRLLSWCSHAYLLVESIKAAQIRAEVLAFLRHITNWPWIRPGLFALESFDDTSRITGNIQPAVDPVRVSCHDTTDFMHYHRQ
ncbi:hypothetical protein D3C79_803800 [compost metagenome]